MIGLFALAAVLFAVLASAQNNHVPGRPGAGVFVLPRPGIPISLEQIEERSSRLDDGTSAVDVIRSRVYRDSSGRLRMDSETQGNSSHPSTAYTQLLDPVAGSRYLLLASGKTAYRLPYPKSGEARFAFLSGDERESSRNWTARTEECGKRTVEGFEFECSRIVQTSDGEPRLTKTVETWFSDVLKLVGSVVESGPYASSTARIYNLRREEPNSELFTVPSDYKIQDVPLPPDSVAP